MARSVVLDAIPGSSEARGTTLQVPARVPVAALVDAAWRLGALPTWVPAQATRTIGSALATCEPARWGAAIEGLGRLSWQAVRTQDQAMVMAITLLTSVVTLCVLVLSDVLHRAVDPRVRLQA